jgi:hypothetical protein
MTALGLDPENSPVDFTAGVGSSSVPSHFANVTIRIHDLTDFSVYAGFTPGLDRHGHGLLGQLGFFDSFHVGFAEGRQGFIEQLSP